MTEGLTTPEKRPNNQELLETLYREKIGSKLPGAREFGEGVSKIIMLALETEALDYRGIVEILIAMKMCLEDENTTPAFKALVEKEHKNLWMLLDEEEKRRKTLEKGMPAIPEKK